MAVRAHGHRHHLILPDCALTSRPAPWPNPDVESHEDTHCRTGAAEANADDETVAPLVPAVRCAPLMERSRLVASTQIAQPQATSSRTGAAAQVGTFVVPLQEAQQVGYEVLCRGIREGTWTGMWTVTQQGPRDGTEQAPRQGTGQGALVVVREVAEQVALEIAEQVARLVPRNTPRDVASEAMRIAMGEA